MEQFPRTGFLRRFASWIYDALAVIAIIMVAEILFLGVMEALLALDVLVNESDKEISEFVQTHAVISVIHQAYLIICALSFFAYFWCRGGQTIGMRAWRLKLQQLDGNRVTPIQAYLRGICALGGLGNLLLLVDFKNKRALQDYIAKTEMITLSKEENKRIYQSLD